jgi:hypothetical protein
MLKIMKVKWERVKSFVYGLNESGKLNRFSFKVDGNNGLATSDELEVIADFIVEAGTVANETGLMPRELQEKWLNALHTLKTIKPYLKDGELLLVQKAIANCEKRG